MRVFVKESAQGVSITSPQMVIQSVMALSQADQELIVLIGFNAKNKEIFREVVFKGGMTECNVDFKVLFRHLLVKGCDAFVVAHNHPSENPNPSEHDIKLTKDLNSVGRLIGIRFFDHIIIGGQEHYSFRFRCPFMFD